MMRYENRDFERGPIHWLNSGFFHGHTTDRLVAAEVSSIHTEEGVPVLHTELGTIQATAIRVFTELRQLVPPDLRSPEKRAIQREMLDRWHVFHSARLGRFAYAFMVESNGLIRLANARSARVFDQAQLECEELEEHHIEGEHVFAVSWPNYAVLGPDNESLEIHGAALRLIHTLHDLAVR